MPTDDRRPPGLPAGARRFLIEIEDWNSSLFVGRSPLSTPREYRIQGGLIYGRNLDLGGRVLAPDAYRGKTIRIWVSPPARFDPEEDEADLIRNPGSFHFRMNNPDIADLSATLHLPGDALTLAVAGLNSDWKFLELWVSGRRADHMKISAFAFLGRPPEKLEAGLSPL